MKTLIFAFLLLVVMPSSKAYAFEEPIAGITPSLTAYEDYRENRAEEGREAYIEDYSRLYGVDSDLVKAIIYAESDGQADAINHNRNGTHDRGLMQINSCNFEWLSEELGITDFYDERQNIQAGCYILGLLSDKYDDYHRVLMAYNMGEKRTRELWNEGERTTKYSKKVMKKYYQLKEGRH
jgi:soluble lytic murein transglycosylase-like protein